MLSTLIYFSEDWRVYIDELSHFVGTIYDENREYEKVSDKSEFDELGCLIEIISINWWII